MLKLAMSSDNERRFLNKPQHAPLLHALPHAPKPETLVLFFICVFVCKNTDSSELSGTARHCSRSPAHPGFSLLQNHYRYSEILAPLQL
jgi:hypothetical protein